MQIEKKNPPTKLRGVQIKGLHKALTRNGELLLMLLPGLTLLVIFRYLPMSNITIAFKDFNIFAGIAGSEWVGFKHFETLFSDPYFYRLLTNTFIISGLKLLVGFPIPILLAIMLNEAGSVAFKRISQNLFYLPHFLSWVVISGLCFDVFSLSGVVNRAISAFGLQPISFLMTPGWFRAVLIISDIWKEAGWGSIVYLSALTSIDSQLYEAARIDGANKFRQLLHITLPGLIPIIIVMFMMKISTVLDAGSDQILMMYNSMVMDSADIIDTYVYRLGIGRMQYDYTTAVGLFKSLVAMAFVLSTNFILKKKRGEGLW